MIHFYGVHTLKMAKVYKILSNSFQMKGREDGNMWTHFCAQVVNKQYCKARRLMRLVTC